MPQAGASTQPGSPVGEFPGLQAEGVAELAVGGLQEAGQGLGRVPQGRQAQLALQPLLAAALRRAGVRREGRVRPAGLLRQRRGLREGGQEVMATPCHRPLPIFEVCWMFLVRLTPAS